MERPQTGSDSKKKIFDPGFFGEKDFDDEGMLEDITFKPITKGLGFHHEQALNHKRRRTPQKNMNTRSTPMPERPLTPTPKPSYRASRSQNSLPEIELPKDLGISQPEKVEVTKISEKLKKANFFEQSVAFCVDLLAIVFLTAFIQGIFWVASPLSISQWKTILNLNEYVLLSLGQFSILFIFYFTILDVSSSPGKTLCGLKMVTTKRDKPLRAYNTFFRSLVTLISLIILGLPLWMDFQGKLSDTMVVKE